MKPAFLALCLLQALALPAAALAQTPMSAAEFERYTTGKTLYFGQGGTPYGVERYEEDRQVTWSFLDGRCKHGEWYEAANRQICFVYEDEPGEHCWQFFEGPSGLTARFGDDPRSVPIYQAEEQEDDMLCLGPDTGV
ncbi:hypothetical protein E0K89_014665 [Aquicoccus sp. SCR17]|nr:hypothetical protein [Carideicomes alvinocaridis]